MTKRMGRPPSQRPSRRGSTIYFDDNLLKRLKMYGVIIDNDISTIVDLAVREYLDAHGAPELPEVGETKKGG